MNVPNTRLTPEHFVKAIEGEINRILREECERLEASIVCQLRHAVRTRLQQMVPRVHLALNQYVFDLELKIDVKLDGKPIVPEPAQPNLPKTCTTILPSNTSTAAKTAATTRARARQS